MRKKIPIILALLAISGTLLPNLTASSNVTIVQDQDLLLPVQRGHASWYSEQDPGINIRTANNEIFDDSGFTAAMWEVPFNQSVRVTNLENGKSVVVRINDRGPHKRFVRHGRIIDLSKKAFSDLAPLDTGLIPIELELL